MTTDDTLETTSSCESCGMPIESGRYYCTHCVDENGQLQPFEQRFATMVDWQLRRNPGLIRAEAEAQTRVYLAGMPAWRDHPQVAGSSGSW